MYKNYTLLIKIRIFFIQLIWIDIARSALIYIPNLLKLVLHRPIFSEELLDKFEWIYILPDKKRFAFFALLKALPSTKTTPFNKQRLATLVALFSLGSMYYKKYLPSILAASL